MPLIVIVLVPDGVPGLPYPCCAVVTIVIIDFADVLPGVTEEGENEQVEDFGRPAHFKDTIEANVPSRAETVIVYAVDRPAVTVAEAGVAESAKSTPVPDKLTLC